MVAAVPDGDEGEAKEEAEGAAHLHIKKKKNQENEGAAHLGHQGGEGVDQLLLLHEGVVRGRPQLEEEVPTVPRQE